MTSLAAEIEPSGDQPPDWRDRAACRHQATPGRDPWHPVDDRESGAYDEARQVCAACPVRPDCIAYALDVLARTGEIHGMYGGLTPAELRTAAAAEGLPARKVAQHGTRSRYVSRKCRCGPCRAANRRDRQARKQAAEPDAPGAGSGRRPGSRGGGLWSWV